MSARGRERRRVLAKEAGWNGLKTNDKVGAHSPHWTGRPSIGISPQELVVKDANLHLGESRSKAEVLAGSKSDVRRLGARDVKARRLGENRFVTIAGAIPENHFVTR